MSTIDIREIHGVKGLRADDDSTTVSVLIDEGVDRPRIILRRPNHDVALTPDQCRYLAKKLFRLASRVDAR